VGAAAERAACGGENLPHLPGAGGAGYGF
jgi:hypothetical protein